MPSFAPIIGSNPHTLILGSMPSVQSLADQQYYAHPRNAFWWIVAQIYGFSATLDYPQRCNAIAAQGVAVWDVLHDCERAGSLDSAIQRASEQANDFSDLLNKYSSIELIAFNGAAANTIFHRHHKNFSQQHESIQLVQLPSSSPAHAAIDKHAKLEIWRQQLQN